MSELHPIIAVTGSSGAGLSTVGMPSRMSSAGWGSGPPF